MYKKISLIDTKEDRSEVEDELFDRYGEPPRETVNLLDVALCRALQRAAGVTRVTYRDSNLLLLSEAKPDLAIWSEVIARHTGLIIKSAAKTDFAIRLFKNESPLKKAIAILSDYYSVDTEKE
jgi:transcription-repair coupling factor (superfamily II helicase)